MKTKFIEKVITEICKYDKSPKTSEEIHNGLGYLFALSTAKTLTERDCWATSESARRFIRKTSHFFEKTSYELYKAKVEKLKKG